MDIFNKLPPELKRIVASYFGYPEVPTCKIIKAEIDMYKEDHNWEYSKYTRLGLVCNYMSFEYYYFDKREEPYHYSSYIKSGKNYPTASEAHLAMQGGSDTVIGLGR